MKRLALVLIGGVMAAAGLVSPASATVPSTGGFTFTGSSIDDGVSAACGFPVLATNTTRGRFEVFFDTSGTPVRIQVEETTTGTFTANGLSVPMTGATLSTFDLINGTETDTGLNIRVFIPGGGNLYLDRGRLVFDSNGNVISEAGKHPSLHGDFDGLCAALTPIGGR